MTALQCACSQGMEVMQMRNIVDRIPLSEVPFIMRALGYYPTEQEVNTSDYAPALGIRPMFTCYYVVSVLAAILCATAFSKIKRTGKVFGALKKLYSFV